MTDFYDDYDSSRSPSEFQDDASSLVETGDAALFLDDELARAHAEEQAAGGSSEDDEDETDEACSSYHNNLPPPLMRYPIHTGEGDIGDCHLVPFSTPQLPPPFVESPSPPRQPALEREASQTTSMLPAEYAEMIGTTRRRRQRRSSCCRADRQRCIGAALSASGVFVLGFMIVLLGHTWYEKNNPSHKNDNQAQSPDDDVNAWTVVQTVTHHPKEQIVPTAAPTTELDTTVDDESINQGGEDKSANITTLGPTNYTATPPPLEPESLPDHVPQLYQLQPRNVPVELALETGQRVYLGTGCSDDDDNNALLVHVPMATAVISATARIRQLSMQLALDDDTTLVVCQEQDALPTAVLHYVLVPAASNQTNEVEWVENLDFTQNNDDTLQVLAPTDESTGMVMLVANPDENVQWFTWHSSNVFAHNDNPQVGDACPVQDSEHDPRAKWWPSHATIRQVSLWKVEPEAPTTIYGCTNSTNVTHVGQVVHGRSSLVIEDDMGRNMTLTDNANMTEAPTDHEAVKDCFLALSDQELWDLSTTQTIGQYCRISISQGNTACRFYAKGRPVQHNGLPLTTDGRGTGCIKDHAGSFCYFQDPDYPLTSEERISMCTDSHVANGAAQIRYGIRNGMCTDPRVPLTGCTVAGNL